MEITRDCAAQYHSRAGANGLKHTTDKQPGDRGRCGIANATRNVESESREKQLAASHGVGDSADDQSCYGARQQPNQNCRLNFSVWTPRLSAMIVIAGTYALAANSVSATNPASKK